MHCAHRSHSNMQGNVETANGMAMKKNVLLFPVMQGWGLFIAQYVVIDFIRFCFSYVLPPPPLKQRQQQLFFPVPPLLVPPLARDGCE